MKNTITPLDQILETLGVRIESKYNGISTDGEWKHFAYTVALSRAGKPGLSVPFRQGMAHIRKVPGGATVPTGPTAAAVVYSLIMDSSACDMDFAYWCTDCGCDPDSRKALDMYLACQDYGRKIRQLLGADFSSVQAAAMEYGS